MREGSRMPRPVTWMRAGDRYPDLKAKRDHFLALDGEEIIGVVRLVDSSPRESRWLWSLVPVRRGRTFPRPRSGTTETRSEAAKALVTTWREFLEWYGE